MSKLRYGEHMIIEDASYVILKGINSKTLLYEKMILIFLLQNDQPATKISMKVNGRNYFR